MKAFLKNYRQSPRKVRLIANLVKGKKVDEALVELDFVTKKAALPLRKLIASATANALSTSRGERDNLYVKSLTVDKGIILKRYQPGARGRAYPINKRSSHVTVELGLLSEKAGKKGKKADKKAKVVETKEATKVPAKKAAAKKTTTRRSTKKSETK